MGPVVRASCRLPAVGSASQQLRQDWSRREARPPFPPARQWRSPSAGVSWLSEDTRAPPRPTSRPLHPQLYGRSLIEVTAPIMMMNARMVVLALAAVFALQGVYADAPSHMVGASLASGVTVSSVV